MDYQKTLNLPQTDFSMKANLVQKEPALLQKWEIDGLYPKLRARSKGKKTFTLHDGPPYANGNIHIGHALNKTLKDFVVKMKTMQGYDSFYVPGWDCHGLPIEHQLFKDLNKRKSEVDTLDLRKKAHAYALKYVDIQREQFKRLGIFGEWAHPYLTLAPEYEHWILRSFGRLNAGGYVYRGLKPVNWCPQCETALAEAEVEYENHTSPSVYVKFQLTNPKALKGLAADKPVLLLIWTTTPWTLLANVAVAVHQAYQYSLVDTGDQILIIESSLAQKVLAKGQIDSAKILQDVPGTALKDLNYVHPFGMKVNSRVITVDYVTKEDGTGLVHTAPGHGQEDFEAGLANKLDVIMPVDDRGIFKPEAGSFAGQHIFKANEEIIKDLQARGILFFRENITHSYPHCWRCKKPVIFRATKQWFLRIDHQNLRGKLKDAIKRQVQWVPAAGEERILGMVVTRPDWCLSRQRHWGVPIPALSCRGCQGEHKLYSAVIDHFAELVKKDGTDIWFERKVQELIPPGFVCPDCQKSDFEKTNDILDVWFDSGVSHQAVIGPMLKQELPADLYLEGSDQHRGWFQSSLIPAVALEGKAPFKAVLTHGFVVDGQGRKMSKSLGNVIAPDDVIKNNGVDILRLWVASSNYNEDIRLSKEILERLIDAYRKIRNTMRYLLGNLSGFVPDEHSLDYARLVDIDQWVLHRLSEVLRESQQAYNDYEFAKVYKLIYGFCNEDLSGFYLDILKDRLYTSPAHARERRSAQTVLYHILNNIVRLLAPMVSFTADEVYEAMPKDQTMSGIGSVHLLPWLEVPPEWINPHLFEQFKPLIEFRTLVLKALEEQRQAGKIGSSLEAKVVIHCASDRDYTYLSKWQEILPTMFIVSQVEVTKVHQVSQSTGQSFSQTEVLIKKADGEKCTRCWNFSLYVGKDAQHPLLCDRCSAAVKEILKVA